MMCTLGVPWQTSVPTFHENWWKTEEVSPDFQEFSSQFFYSHNWCRYWWQLTTFYHCLRSGLYWRLLWHHFVHTLCQRSWNWWKTSEVVRDASSFPPFSATREWSVTMGNIEFYLLSKNCTCIHGLPQIKHLCSKWHENWSKTDKYNRDA